MNKIFLLIFLTGLFGSVQVRSQIRKIPATVTDRFTQQYPMATSIEWRDRLTSYSADFKLNDTLYTAFYNNEGDWTSTETIIDAGSLPTEVRTSYDKSKYAAWEVGTIHQIILPGSAVQYRVQAIKSEIRKRNLYFDPEGRMLRDLATL